ncbi:MAG: c-type cytochrome [Pseudomonadota bacterium]
MKSRSTLKTLTTLLLASLLSMPALAGDPEAGKNKSLVCAGCHGQDGNSLNPEWPSLANQHESYIKSQLESFRSGYRQNALMSVQATNLTDEDIADLAAYYASLPLKGGEADPDLVELGERLYRGGNKDSGVSACIACHGPAGAGNPMANMPRIGGQNAGYTMAQLKNYAGDNRQGVGGNQMMNNVANLMTDEEIKAVASYVQGLRGQ